MSRFLVLFCAVLFVFSGLAFAELKELANAEEFETAIQEAKVPAIVQFSAYWCNPCQKLKKTLIDVSANYQDDQVLIYYVDAYVNSSLKKYLNGGYPTTRVFSQGKMGAQFVGSKSASFVTSFIDSAIQNKVEAQKVNSLIELNSLEEFNQTISSSEVPVMVQFSAYWCGPCQRLKETMKRVAPQYSASEIKLCYVDAYKISSLKSYLEGGYPTTKVFRQGKVGSDFFVGNASEQRVKSFIDNNIKVEVSAVNSLIEFKTAEEFELAIQSAKVPVVVQFSAYWCGPCKKLKATLENVVPSYSQDKVQICYVDAYVNSSLKKYLDGGYPTVKVFSNGKLTKGAFVGSKSEAFVRDFLDQVVKENE